MMKLILTTFLAPLLVSLISEAQNSGFSKGNHFDTYNISGNITVRCNDYNSGFQVVYHTCRASLIDPVAFDYFVGPKNIDSDQVELTVTRADQSVKTKTTGYDSIKGISTSRFNLWVVTVLQRPLLMNGLNKVEYKLKNQNTVVNSGQFEASVTYKGEKVCAPSVYNSPNITDCRQPYSVCDQYFADNNNCL